MPTILSKNITFVQIFSKLNYFMTMKNRVTTHILLLVLFFTPLSTTRVFGQDLYDTTKIQEIKLYFTQPNWDFLLDTAASNYESYIFCRRAVINGVVFDSIGAKYKGNSTYSPTRVKNPWHLELDTYKNQDYGGIKDIKLSNIMFDPSHIREVLAYNLLQSYMHAPRANFAKVWVNDTLMGLYSNTEAITKTFVKREFQSNSPNNAFYKCNAPFRAGMTNRTPNFAFLTLDTTRYYNAYEMKSDYGWRELADLCDTLNNKFGDIEKILDIDRAIWFLAFNNVFVNLDSYSGGSGHNHYLFRDDNRRWNNIVWDVNMSFGSFRNTGSTPPTIDTVTAARLNPFLHAGNLQRPLINNILANPTYRRMYVAHMKTILNENFRNDAYKPRAIRWHSLIDSAVQEDRNKFSTYDQYKVNLYHSAPPATVMSQIGVFSLMDRRTKFLLDSVAEFRAVPPMILPPSVSPASPRLNDSVWITTRVTGSVPTNIYLGFRNNNRLIFTKTPLFDDGLHRDGAANDGIWGAGVKATAASIEYYIYAENAQAGIFSPERAEHEFHKINEQVTGALNRGDVVINEIMADNTRTVRNPKGEYADWVELHNRTNQTVSLAGAFLSDDKAFRTKWKFPAATTLPANSYLIVWCDDDSLNVTDTRPHTSFKLSNNGETVILSNSALAMVDSVTFAKQRADTSWARFPNGTGAFRFLLPTFNAPNVSTSTQSVFKNTQIRLYPNPTDGFLTVENLQNTPLSNLRIFDVTGRVVFEVSTIEERQTILDLGHLSDGLYFLKTGNTVQKFVIQR
jgi:spore coat protein CotH